MADVLRDQVADMIGRIMKHYGWSASRLAKEVGVAPSTITRALDPKSSFTPSGATVNKIVPMLAKITVEQGNKIVDLQGDIADRYTELFKGTGSLPVVGDIEAGVWKDGAFNVGKPEQLVAIIDPSWSGRSLVAYRIVGDHTDKEFASGSIVIVDKDPKNMREGDICVLRRKVHFLGSAKFETTLWNFEMVDDDVVALPRVVGGPALEKIDQPVLDYKMDFLGVVVASYHRIDRDSRPLLDRRPKGIG